jgi:hypothetical protein
MNALIRIAAVAGRTQMGRISVLIKDALDERQIAAVRRDILSWSMRHQDRLGDAQMALEATGLSAEIAINALECAMPSGSRYRNHEYAGRILARAN